MKKSVALGALIAVLLLFASTASAHIPNYDPRVECGVASTVDIPGASSTALDVRCSVFYGGVLWDPNYSEASMLLTDSQGNSEHALIFDDFALGAAASNPSSTATNFPSASGWRLMNRLGVGLYQSYLKINTADSAEILTMNVAWENGGVVHREAFAVEMTAIGATGAALAVVDANVDDIILELGDMQGLTLTSASAAIGDSATSLNADLASIIAEVPSTDTWGAGASADASAGQNVISTALGVADALIDRLDDVSIIKGPCTLDGVFAHTTTIVESSCLTEAAFFWEGVGVVITDADTPTVSQVRYVLSYDAVNARITLSGALGFTPVNGDTFYLIPAGTGWVTGNSSNAGAALDGTAGVTLFAGLRNIYGFLDTEIATIVTETSATVAGRMQTLTFNTTAAANAGDIVAFTASGGSMQIEACSIRSNIVSPAHMTTAGLYAIDSGAGGAAGAQVELIAVATATKANLDEDGEQVAWTGYVTIDATETVYLDLQGTGADAIDLTVKCNARGDADGATM